MKLRVAALCVGGEGVVVRGIPMAEASWFSIALTQTPRPLALELVTTR